MPSPTRVPDLLGALDERDQAPLLAAYGDAARTSTQLHMCVRFAKMRTVARDLINRTALRGGFYILSQWVGGRVRYTARQAGWVRRPAASSFGEEFASLYDRCAPFTMTSVERMYALFDAVKYVDRAGIPGDIVECGVWRGGSAMLAMLAGGQRSQRHLYLYDTFTGMTEPGPEDGRHMHGLWEKHQAESGWAYAPLEEVRNNLLANGTPPDRFTLVQGKVEDTLPDRAPERVALLRLDTDWYSSTHHELVHLYPLLAPGGVLIIDDYGEFDGARRAVDEYLEQIEEELLLARIDGTGRLAVKPPTAARRYDRAVNDIAPV